MPVWEIYFSYLAILASCFKIVLAKFDQSVDISTCQWTSKLITAKSGPDSKITIFLHLPFYYKVHPNPILFDFIKFYSTKFVFKIIRVVCIELWEVHKKYVYINFIWSRFGIGRHLLACSINKADAKHFTTSPISDFEGFLHIFYCRIKNFMESLTEKLLRQVGWQGWVQNNRKSPHDVWSLDCRVLTQTYSPNLFSSRFWRAVVSFTAMLGFQYFFKCTSTFILKFEHFSSISYNASHWNQEVPIAISSG